MSRRRALYIAFSMFAACLTAPAADGETIKRVSGDLLPYAAQELPAAAC